MTTLLANIIVSQVIEHPKTTENISVLGKPSKKKSLTFVIGRGGRGQRVFVTKKKQTKKNSQNDFWGILSIFGVFSFSPFFGMEG